MRIDSFAPSVSMTASPSGRFDTPTGARGGPRTDDEASTNQARLQAIVELIKSLTGRDVELVPPSPYFTSGPAMPKPAPKPAPVELTLPQRPWGSADQPTHQPIKVDITDVLRRGTTPHMRLHADDQGQLALFPDLIVEL